MKKIKHLETILSIVLGLSVIFLFTRNEDYPTANKFLPPAIVVLSAIGLLSPYLTEKIHRLWMGIAHVMGSIMSKVILTILFYAFLFPIAMLARLFSKGDSLQLKKTTGTSYY